MEKRHLNPDWVVDSITHMNSMTCILTWVRPKLTILSIVCALTRWPLTPRGTGGSQTARPKNPQNSVLVFWARNPTRNRWKNAHPKTRKFLATKFEIFVFSFQRTGGPTGRRVLGFRTRISVEPNPDGTLLLLLTASVLLRCRSLYHLYSATYFPMAVIPRFRFETQLRRIALNRILLEWDSDCSIE